MYIKTKYGTSKQSNVHKNRVMFIKTELEFSVNAQASQNFCILRLSKKKKKRRK
jgi:hypothetical protein